MVREFGSEGDNAGFIFQRRKDIGQRLRTRVNVRCGKHQYSVKLALQFNCPGFTVKCVLRSTMEGTFEGLEGAALYRTDRGDFETLFLPKPQTFAGMIVIEEQQNGRYIYSFHGTPRPWPADRVDSLRPISFLWRPNQLLVIRDDQLRVKLEEVLNP